MGALIQWSEKRSIQGLKTEIISTTADSASKSQGEWKWDFTYLLLFRFQLGFGFQLWTRNNPNYSAGSLQSHIQCIYGQPPHTKTWRWVQSITSNNLKARLTHLLAHCKYYVLSTSYLNSNTILSCNTCKCLLYCVYPLFLFTFLESLYNIFPVLPVLLLCCLLCNNVFTFSICWDYRQYWRTKISSLSPFPPCLEGRVCIPVFSKTPVNAQPVPQRMSCHS